MQAAIEIPAPTESDSETVATALETAAVFNAKGDTAEALRWLQRAAESAGDAGDDVRTLTLARTAADLNRSLRESGKASESPAAAPESAAPRRLPKPPQRQNSSLPASDEESPFSLSQRPEPVRIAAPSLAPPSSTRPPPPSTRSVTPAPSRAANVVSGVAGTASVAPRQASFGTKSSLPSERRRPSSAAPGPVSQRPEPRPSWRTGPQVNGEVGAVDVVEPTSVRPRPSERAAQRAGVSIAQRSEAAPQSVAEENLRSDVEHVSLRPPEQKNIKQRLRAAARVSVVASSTEPGLYFVRVLEDGQSAPSSSTEALMVLLDPNSPLFSG